MFRSETRATAFVSLGALLAVFAALTAQRVVAIGLPSGVQSAIVWSGAAAVVAVCAAISYRGGQFITDWIVAIGPVLGYTWTLPFTLAGGDQRLSLAVFAYTGVGGVLAATALAAVGFAAGRVAAEAVATVDR